MKSSSRFQRPKATRPAFVITQPGRMAVQAAPAMLMGPFATNAQRAAPGEATSAKHGGHQPGSQAEEAPAPHLEGPCQRFWVGHGQAASNGPLLGVYSAARTGMKAVWTT